MKSSANAVKCFWKSSTLGDEISQNISIVANRTRSCCGEAEATAISRSLSNSSSVSKAHAQQQLRGNCRTQFHYNFVCTRTTTLLGHATTKVVNGICQYISGSRITSANVFSNLSASPNFTHVVPDILFRKLEIRQTAGHAESVVWSRLCVIQSVSVFFQREPKLRLHQSPRDMQATVSPQFEFAIESQ